jgi:hypothetical protein
VLQDYVKARDLVKEIQAQFKSEYQNQFIDWSASFDHIKKSLKERSSVPKEDGKPLEKVLEPKSQPLKPIPKPNREPLDYTQVQSIYQSMKPTEKRHYELPKTFDLAKDVLERAASRQSSR